MSLLTLVRESMLMCGLARQSTAYANTDDTVQEFVTWAQIEGDDLVTMDWPQLKVLVTITGDGSSTTYDLPTDFSRWAGGSTFYLDGESGGPLYHVTDEEMLSAKAASFSPVRPIWRRFGDQVEFYPALTTSQTAKAEYRSEYWIMESTLTTRQAAWDADDNEPLFPDAVMRFGIAWRWKMSKGLDYEPFRAEWKRMKTLHFAHQDGRKNIYLPTVYPSDMVKNLSDPQVIP